MDGQDIQDKRKIWILFILYIPVHNTFIIDFQKNNFAALSVGNGRKRPIPSLLPCEMNFLKVYSMGDTYVQQ